MRMENKKRPKTEKTKREDAPEDRKENILSKKPETKEEPSDKERRKKRDRTVIVSCI